MSTKYSIVIFYNGSWKFAYTSKYEDIAKRLFNSEKKAYKKIKHFYNDRISLYKNIYDNNDFCIKSELLKEITGMEAWKNEQQQRIKSDCKN